VSNPFAKKPPKIGGAPAFKRKPKRLPGNNSSVGVQPHLTEEWRKGYAERLAHGQKMLDDLGIEVGDTIRVTWSYDSTRTHTGIVIERDDWLKCKPFSTSNGRLHLPIAALQLVGRVEKEA
jgi:hypothetical protein